MLTLFNVIICSEGLTSPGMGAKPNLRSFIRVTEDFEKYELQTSDKDKNKFKKYIMREFTLTFYIWFIWFFNLYN